MQSSKAIHIGEVKILQWCHFSRTGVKNPLGGATSSGRRSRTHQVVVLLPDGSQVPTSQAYEGQTVSALAPPGLRGPNGLSPGGMLPRGSLTHCPEWDHQGISSGDRGQPRDPICSALGGDGRKCVNARKLRVSPLRVGRPAPSATCVTLCSVPITQKQTHGHETRPLLHRPHHILCSNTNTVQPHAGFL